MLKIENPKHKFVSHTAELIILMKNFFKKIGSKTLNFIEDEEITEYMRKYPCLYDKSDKNGNKSKET